MKRNLQLSGLIVAALLGALPLLLMSGETNPPPDNPRYHFSLISVDDGSIGRFAFRHSYDKPIQLFGFGFEGTNVFRVRFERYQREEVGRWTNVMVYYCGTGAQYYPIEPNKDYVFLVVLHPFEEKGTRGIVELEGKDIHIYSNPFDTAEITAMANKKRTHANKPSDRTR
ncbi:MAG: hypothetical protein HYV36_03145 [Lentisphaerae bacterium]|nr:hypothetical protein [Lentisphaerota bacterium]